MKVLFIGNSHTFVHYVPARFLRFCADQGVAVDVTMLTHPGMGIDWHMKQSQTYFNLLYGNYDAVVLQHLAHPFPGREHLIDSMEAINKIIPAGTKKFIYMPWSEKVNPEGQALLTEANETAAERIGATICPVGKVWWPIKEAHPCEELYFNDGEHTSPLGASLAAVVIGRTILGLPTDDAEACYADAQKLLLFRPDDRMPDLVWQDDKPAFCAEEYNA